MRRSKWWEEEEGLNLVLGGLNVCLEGYVVVHFMGAD